MVLRESNFDTKNGFYGGEKKSRVTKYIEPGTPKRKVRTAQCLNSSKTQYLRKKGT